MKIKQFAFLTTLTLSALNAHAASFCGPQEFALRDKCIPKASVCFEYTSFGRDACSTNEDQIGCYWNENLDSCATQGAELTDDAADALFSGMLPGGGNFSIAAIPDYIEKPKVSFNSSSELVSFYTPPDTETQQLLNDIETQGQSEPVFALAAPSVSELGLYQDSWKKDGKIFGIEARVLVKSVHSNTQENISHSIDGQGNIKGKVLTYNQELIGGQIVAGFDQKNTPRDKSDDERFLNTKLKLVGKTVWDKQERRPGSAAFYLPTPDPIRKTFYENPGYVFLVYGVPFTAKAKVSGELGLRVANATQSESLFAMFEMTPYTAAIGSGTVEVGTQELKKLVKKLSLGLLETEALGGIDVELLSVDAPLRISITSLDNRVTVYTEWVMEKLRALKGKVYGKLKLTVEAKVVKSIAKKCKNTLFEFICESVNIESWSKPKTVVDQTIDIYKFPGMTLGNSHRIFSKSWSRNIPVTEVPTILIPEEVTLPGIPTPDRPESIITPKPDPEVTPQPDPIFKPVPMPNAPIKDGGIYALKSKNSARCLDLQGGNVNNGTLLQQWDCQLDNQNQQFRFVAVGNGFFEIRNVRSNRCISVDNFKKDNGTRIHNWDCYGNADQKFRLGNTKFPGAYNLRFQHSDMCVDVEGKDTANGKIVNQWQCFEDAPDQAWDLIPIGETSAEVPSDFSASVRPSFDPNATYELRSVNSDKCLDLRDWNANNGGILQQWDCGRQNNQKFKVKDIGNGYYEFINVHAGKCISVDNFGQGDGTKVHSWQCYGNQDQRFRLTRNQYSGSYSLRFQHSDKCLDVEGKDKNNGLIVHQWTCNSSAADQAWLIQRID